MPALDQLTARERQVLIGVARGQTNKEIAHGAGHQPPHGREPSREPDAEARGPHRGRADPARARGGRVADRSGVAIIFRL